MSEGANDTRETGNNSQTSSYRNIFKATSLFGGVQVYQILIGIIKSKVVAVLLGPAGMGIMGLYQSALDMIKSVTSLGLEQSAVRDVSDAKGSGDEQRVGKILTTVNKLAWITGLLGLIITLFLAPLLSKITFGNNDYTWGFIILSSTLLINQLCAGQKVILQGMRRLKDLAKASAIGSTVGLLVSIPIYYWLGVKGIVPTMLIISLTAMFLSWYYSRRIHVPEPTLSSKQVFENGRSMIRMGVAMSFSGILVTLFAYVLRWFIRYQGGVEGVGLFNAGFVIVSSYVGMVFTAMGADFYPRLSAVNHDNAKCREIINQQGEIAVLILAPIIVFCIIFTPILIRLIYSEVFLPAHDYILFAVTGTMFKAASWVIAFIFLAKAESKLFIINETFSNVYMLILNLFGYRIGGLTGLGISYLLGYCIYTIQVYLITKTKYKFSFTKSFSSIFIVESLLVGVCVFFAYLLPSQLFIIAASIVLLFSIIFSVISLNNRINFIELFNRRR